MSACRTKRICVVAVCALALMLWGTIAPSTGFAAESASSAELQAQADSMAQKIEQATATYAEAEAAANELEERIAQNEARTAEIEAKLPEQRSKAAESIKSMYMLQQSSMGLLDLILSADNFNDFITMVSYLDTIHERNADQINELVSLDRELSETKAELTLQYDAAAQARDDAMAALEEVRAAKRELQRRADEQAAAEAKAREEAIAAAKAAVEAAQQEAQQAQEPKDEPEEKGEEEPKDETPAEEQSTEATFTTSSGNTTTIEVPEETASPSTEPLTTNTTSSETSNWAARIDAYLAGSPLAGYGSTFAEAAAAYGVDPRLSPAISCVESSKGAICFLPHNAWGWGRSSWSDWKSAINDHVAGLAAYYGGTLSIEGAQRYCPPSYQAWYSSVLAEVNSI